MYGNYLVPNQIVDGPLLEELLKNHHNAVLPESITFVCELVEKENLNFKLSPYIPLGLTYFISDMIHMSYIIEETQKTININLMTYALINYFFVDNIMTRKTRFGYDQVKKDLFKYKTVWPSNDAESLS